MKNSVLENEIVPALMRDASTFAKDVGASIIYGCQMKTSISEYRRKKGKELLEKWRTENDDDDAHQDGESDSGKPKVVINGYSVRYTIPHEITKNQQTKINRAFKKFEAGSIAQKAFVEFVLMTCPVRSGQKTLRENLCRTDEVKPFVLREKSKPNSNRIFSVLGKNFVYSVRMQIKFRNVQAPYERGEKNYLSNYKLMINIAAFCAIKGKKTQR